MTLTTLFYIHDPMCSWCYGFNNTWKKVKKSLPKSIDVKYVIGGLAPDSSEPMSTEMREYIQKNWQKIEMSIPEVKFNYDFWKKCMPKRSPYPACRAVIAIKRQKPSLEVQMIDLIQKSYYLEAKNPSEDSTLIDLASKLDIDIKKFAKNLNDDKTQQILLENINLAQKLGAKSFPSLILQEEDRLKHIKIDYNDSEFILKQIIS